MKVGILAIGNELISGMTQDTNSSYISRELNAEGWEVAAFIAVGDDEKAVESGIGYLRGVSDAIVVSGGLGPTVDDKTTSIIARICGLDLFTDEAALERIKERFERLNLRWTPNNEKQAMFPEGAEIIPNSIGTACGFMIKDRGKAMFFLPGVPSEMRKMFSEGVMPLLEREFGKNKKYIAKKKIKIFGLTEARVDEVVSPLGLENSEISIGFYPAFPEIHVVVTSAGEDKDRVAKALEASRVRIVEKLRKNVFGYDDEIIEGVVGELLKERGLTLSVAESCTGGLIADRFTDVPGSSAFLERGAVVYSNTSKTEILGVPSSVIEKYGAVSEETAVFMAEGVRKMAKTDLGLATTGIAGPSGGSAEKPVGTVFISLSDGKNTLCRKFLFKRGRREVKEMASQWALEMLRRFLIGEKQDD